MKALVKKQCHGECKEEKLETEFYKGFTVCKACCSKRAKMYYAAANKKPEIRKTSVDTESVIVEECCGWNGINEIYC